MKSLFPKVVESTWCGVWGGLSRKGVFKTRNGEMENDVTPVSLNSASISLNITNMKVVSSQ